MQRNHTRQLITISLVTFALISCRHSGGPQTLEDDQHGIRERAGDTTGGDSLVGIPLEGTAFVIVPASLPKDKTESTSGFPSIKDLKFTAVIIGPNVVLTAAHVFANSKLKTIDILSTSGSCKVPDEYVKGNYSADIALCLMENALKIKGPYEAIDPTAAATDISQLKVMGYGCKGDGALTIRTGSLRDPPAGLSLPTPNYWYFLDVCLCLGNSGGPAFLETGNSQRIVGVISKVDHCTNNHNPSRITRFHPNDIGKWILNWVKSNHAKVCGIEASTPNCRP